MILSLGTFGTVWRHFLLLASDGQVVRNAARHPTMPKTVPHNKELSCPNCQQCIHRLRSPDLDYCDCIVWTTGKAGPDHTLGRRFFLKELCPLCQSSWGRSEAWPQGRRNTFRRTPGQESKARAYSMGAGDPWEKGWYCPQGVLMTQISVLAFPFRL